MGLPRPDVTEGCIDWELQEKWEEGGYIWRIMIGKGANPEWGIGITLRQCERKENEPEEGQVLQEIWVADTGCDAFYHCIKQCHTAVKMWADGKSAQQIEEYLAIEKPEPKLSIVHKIGKIPRSKYRAIQSRPMRHRTTPPDDFDGFWKWMEGED